VSTKSPAQQAADRSFGSTQESFDRCLGNGIEYELEVEWSSTITISERLRGRRSFSRSNFFMAINRPIGFWITKQCISPPISNPQIVIVLNRNRTRDFFPFTLKQSEPGTKRGFSPTDNQPRTITTTTTRTIESYCQGSGSPPQSWAEASRTFALVTTVPLLKTMSGTRFPSRIFPITLASA
jgi:hypothetical protein